MKSMPATGALCCALLGVGPVHGVGASAGGRVLAEAALMKPQWFKSLVLSEPLIARPVDPQALPPVLALAPEFGKVLAAGKAGDTVLRTAAARRASALSERRFGKRASARVRAGARRDTYTAREISSNPPAAGVPSMATVSVEMMPIEFPFVDITKPFLVNDLVTFTSAGKPTMEGRVTKLQMKTYGLEQTPGAAVSVAITDGNMKAFKSGGVAGYTATKKGDPTTMATVRKGATIASFAQLMDVRELQVMVDTAEELINRAATLKLSDPIVKWFGQAGFEPAARQRIHERCAELRAGVGGFSKVVFQCAPAESLGAIDNLDPLRGGGTCRIRLGRGFTYDRYSWGERVCTIVHEMTHWTLNTVDVNIDGLACYGGLCLKLARSTSKVQREMALNNADNWGYYICEYRAPKDGRDWRFFSEQEIESRGPFVSNAYNLVPSLIAHH